MNFAEAEVAQGDAFAGRGEQRTIEGVAKRTKPLWIAQQGQFAHGIQENKVVCPIESLAQSAKQFDEIGAILAAHFVRDRVHDHFRVVVSNQMILRLGKQFPAKSGEIGKLSVEGDAEPFPLVAVLAFERLGIFAGERSASGVADMADRRRTVVLVHDIVVFFAMIELERLDHRADFLVGVKQFIAVGVVGGKAGGQLPAILQIQEQARHQAGDIVRLHVLKQGRWWFVRKMIDGRDSAFMLQFVHFLPRRDALQSIGSESLANETAPSLNLPIRRRKAKCPRWGRPDSRDSELSPAEFALHLPRKPRKPRRGCTSDGDQNGRASAIFRIAGFFDIIPRPPGAPLSAPPRSTDSVIYGRVMDDAE